MSLEISNLSNGLTIVTDKMAGLESAAIGVWVGTGSRNETRRQMGISHMLEHMAFKGTKKRNARQIAEEIEAVGGYLNAYTSREQTAFHARVLKADVALGLEMIADLLTESTYDPSELERERQVVLQELGQARDTPDDIIFDHLQNMIYQDQALGWPILGEEDTVAAFTQEDLFAYSGARYRAPGMALVSSGAVSHDEMVAIAAEKFSKLGATAAAPTQNARYVGGDYRETQDLEQTHIAFAFPGISARDPDFYVAQLYAMVLGGGMSSRLFQEVREKRGLCYTIQAFANNFQDGGFTGIYVGTSDKDAGEVSAVIAGEMEAMTGHITDAELNRAKAQAKSSLLMGLERPGTRSENIAGQLFALGRVVPMHEIIEKLEATTVEQVKAYAAFTMQAPSIAALGPIGKLESHVKFSARFSPLKVAHAAE
jgi:predicted Zn-dependent peptidase